MRLDHQRNQAFQSFLAGGGTLREWVSLGHPLPAITGADRVTDVFPDVDAAALDTVAALDEQDDQLLTIAACVEAIARGRELTDEQREQLGPDLSALLEGRGESGDADYEPGLSADEALAALDRAGEQHEAIQNRRGEIEQADADRQAAVDAAAARLNRENPDDPPPADDDAGDGDPADPDADPAATLDPAADPVTAGGRPAPARRLPRLGRSDRATPRDQPAGGTVLALTDVPGVVGPGQELRTMEQIGQAFESRIRGLRHVPGHEGQRFSVVGFRTPRRTQLRVGGRNPQQNTQAFRQVIQEQGGVHGTLVAHGGIHVPTPAPAFTFPDSQISSATPLIDLLPTVNADRGGITFFRPPTLVDAPSTAIGDVTATEDASATPSDYTKTVGRIAFSPSPVTVLVDAVYQYLEWGVFDEMTWPEMIDYFVRLTDAATARFREARVLTSIQAASTAVTPTVRPTDGATQPITPTNTGGTPPYAPTPLAWSAWVVAELDLLATGYRQSHRLPQNLRLRVIAPRWVRDLYVREQIWRGRLDADPAEFEQALAQRGLVISYFDDSPTSPAMNFAVQNAAAIKPFPATAELTIFPDGTFVRLDGGQYNVGVVRDSALITTNDVRSFVEVFENVAKVGNDSYKMQFSTAISGAYTDAGIKTAA